MDKFGFGTPMGLGDMHNLINVLFTAFSSPLPLLKNHNFVYVYFPSIEQVPFCRKLVVLSPDMLHEIL